MTLLLRQLNIPKMYFVISGVQFAYDNRMLATKSNDETLKLWDMRSFKKPVNVAEGLFSRFDQTDVLFSPDDKLIVTPTSKEKNEVGGSWFSSTETLSRSRLRSQ